VITLINEELSWEIRKQETMPQNSPANPLPTAFCGLKIRCRQARQIVGKLLIYNICWTLMWCPSGLKDVFPCHQGNAADWIDGGYFAT
jgi:hypothetical protein